MKIGILTYHFANNYGAVLQVYAMKEFLQENGYEVEIINYVTKLQKSNNSFIENCGIKSVVKNIIRIPHLPSRIRRIRRFDFFREKYLLKNISEINQINVLKERVREYDLLIVGGDQVWNPNVEDFDEIYYKVVNLNTPTMAVSLSFGNAEKRIVEKYIKEINKFRFIGIREKSGLDMLKKMGVKNNCYNTLDPVLLVNYKYYSRLIQNEESHSVPDKPYILCYYLGRKNSFKAVEYVKKISKKLGLEMVFVTSNNGVVSYLHGAVLDAGPIDFLHLIKNAKCVFTNSFHATAFSVLYEVPFYCMEKRESNDNRKIDLLNLLDIRDRVVFDFDNLDQICLNNDEIKNARKKMDLLANDTKSIVLSSIEKVFKRDYD